jgi:hypothetical protein
LLWRRYEELRAFDASRSAERAALLAALPDHF